MKRKMSDVFEEVFLCFFFACFSMITKAEPPCVSGIYPSLAMYNLEGECGTGALVPWADRLWAVTYAPHAPNGSSDKLYEITPDMNQIVRKESIGGTPANRMIHRESEQLFIGPYVIDAKRNVRVIPPSRMYGRLTANMRHLTDPANKIYYATMEEGIYEVDVHSLGVKELYRDGNLTKNMAGDLLPGYHGKGAYSGQGRVIYANNGEHSPLAMRNPEITSGVLAQWDGKEWKIVLRNQFTDVTGPGGIFGSKNPATDPIWAIGWDNRSLLLMCLDHGVWNKYRLPKGSHSYDGAHGWNTEWPRIREIGEADLLMTMHGTFWRFPKTFDAAHTAGISPRSNYLKVIGDFCRWGDRVVLGCDDSAKSEFMNKRAAKGTLHGSGQSNSNLWFVEPERLDQCGPVIGRGSVWNGGAVAAGEASDPYLFSGYDRRSLYLSSDTEVDFTLETNDGGKEWKTLEQLHVVPGKLTERCFVPSEKGAWIRLVSRNAAQNVYAVFQYANEDRRGTTPVQMFDSIAKTGCPRVAGGIVYGRGANKRTAGLSVDGSFYELTPELQLLRRNDPVAAKWVEENYPMNGKGMAVDEASAIITDDGGHRWRFPVAVKTGARKQRLCREVSTERDMLNLCGTFYELPAENAGGYGKIRAIATHALEVVDYCSWRGLILLTGLDADRLTERAGKNGHVIVADDGKAAVWAGVIDDMWMLGKPRGNGGPWKNTSVKANTPSDPYLMTGFDRKTLLLSQTGASLATVTVELDITGTGVWRVYERYAIPGGESRLLDFSGVRAYWVRFSSDAACTATAQLQYE